METGHELDHWLGPTRRANQLNHAFYILSIVSNDEQGATDHDCRATDLD